MSAPYLRHVSAVGLTILAALISILGRPAVASAYGPDCCGDVGTEPCDVAGSGNPCCSDQACCQEVCGVDAYCCETEWDDVCAGEVPAICDCQPQDAPPNDNCTSAAPIGLGTTAITNICATGSGPAHASCVDPDTSNLGLDVWYTYTASFTGPLTVGTCDQSGVAWDTQITVNEGCNCAALSNPPYGCNNDQDHCTTGSSLLTVNVTFGSCYLIRVGSTIFGLSGNALLTLSTAEWTCNVSIPPGAVAEAETCGQNTNGGCDNAQPAFTTVACGAIRRGTAWNNDVNGDRDWYQISLSQQTPVTITLQSDFPGAFGVAQTNPPGSASCAAWTGAFSPSQTSLPCSLAYLQTTLPAGTSRIRVATTGLDDVPCGGQIGNDYVLTLTCQGNCPTDLNGDGATNASDLALLLGAWGPQPDHPADFNNDGVVNASDLALLLGAWGPCMGSSGACCNADDQGTCLQLTTAACASASGLYLGNGSSCSDCPPNACITSNADCCSFHNSPGCAVLDCCESVCAAQPFCCDIIWDNQCVQLAEQLCPACGG